MGDIVRFPNAYEVAEREPAIHRIEVVTIKDLKREIRWTALASGLFGAGIAFLVEVFM